MNTQQNETGGVSHKRVQAQRMLDLMAAIEDSTGKMLHEFDPRLDKLCEKAMNIYVYSCAILALTKKLDEINKGE